MNAIDLLMRDHRTAEKLFSELHTATSAERERLFGLLNEELRAHTEAEEAVLYPALRAQSADLVTRSIKEHAIVRRMLGLLSEAVVDSEAFQEDLTDLQKSVQEHIREEEEPGGLMNIALQQLTESALDKMGDEIERFKMERGGQLAA